MANWTGDSDRVMHWKLVEGSRSCEMSSCEQPQLFDLEKDLGEQKDLANAHPDILKALQEEFRRWHSSVMTSRRFESNCRRVERVQYFPR